jgi:hypothetical protein
MRIVSMMAVLALLIGVSTARADVVRHPIPNSSFPISQSVEVSGNVTTYFVSGQVPPVVDKTADERAHRPMATPRPRPLVCSTRSKAFLKDSDLAWVTSSRCRYFW